MILCIDVGYCATGWCLFAGRTAMIPAGDEGTPRALVDRATTDVPMNAARYLVARAAGVVVATDGLSPKAMRAKRACDLHGERFVRLFAGLRGVLREAYAQLDVAHDQMLVVAEVPTMGAQGAAANRGMALGLAAYYAAMEVDGHDAPGLDYVRSDVIAAAFGRLRPVGDVKEVVRKFVQRRMYLDLDHVPPSLHEHVYDAAAVLFAARDTRELRVQSWTNAARLCLVPATRGEAVACACAPKKKARRLRPLHPGTVP